MYTSTKLKSIYLCFRKETVINSFANSKLVIDKVKKLYNKLKVALNNMTYNKFIGYFNLRLFGDYKS